ncbi:hypothetical protein MMC17_005747 [Xylographa soralifera]|nr:hypothetical protein [Xylographa soralifera]
MASAPIVMLGMTIHTDATSEEIRNFKPTNSNFYTNRLGESLMQITFNRDSRPPGYVFVPAGNVYITRHCRRLTNESGRSVEAVYRGKSQKKLAKQVGIHVPEDVFEQVASDFETFETRGSEKLWRRLHKNYPKMPLVDKNEIHHAVSSRYSNPGGKSALNELYVTIDSYIRDRYTAYKLLNIHKAQDTDAFSEVRQKIRKTIALWRGEN